MMAGLVTPSALADETAHLSPLVVQARRLQSPSPMTAITPLEPESPRLTDLFRQVPGLVTQQSFGGFDPPRLAVRGSGLQSAPSNRGLQLSLFGMPMNAADGSFNLALIESEWLDAVELTRGTAAGKPALGGAMDFGDDPFAPGGGLSGSYGSHETVALHAAGSHRGPSATHAGRAAFTRSDGWRPHSAQERESLLGGSRFQLDDDATLAILFLATRPWYEVPGPLTESAALNTPEAPQASIVRDRPRRETGYAQLSARAEKPWNDYRLSLAMGAVRSEDTFYQLQANGVAVTDATDAWLQARAERDWGHPTQRTAISALLQSGWWDSLRYRNDQGDKGALIGDHQLRPLSASVTIDHRMDVTDHHHLDLGISTLTARRDIEDHFDGIAGSAPLDLDFAGTRLAPRVAWSWDVATDTTLTASWSRSYEAPTYSDLIHTAGPVNARVLRSTRLDWQRADTIELAMRGQSDRIHWTAAIYHASWENEFLRLANPDGSSRGTVNAGDTMHSGFEGSLACELLRAGDFTLNASAIYNYSHAQFDDDPVYGDRRLAGVPPHTGWIGLRAAHSAGWFIAPGCEVRAGTTYADHANDLDYGSSALWSLELGRRHPDGWGLTLAIQNLFDSACIASTTGLLDRAANPSSTAIFLPAAGRTVSLRLEYTW